LTIDNQQFIVADHNDNINGLKESGFTYVDIVYTFTKDNPTLRFDNLFFEKFYFYDIKVAIVSPHTGGIKIELWDPENDLYQLSNEENITQEDYRIIPFGTALSGNHSIKFHVFPTVNLNVHIIIEQTTKCLYDSIESNADIVYYNVSKFFDGDFLVVEPVFKTDKFYRFYFQRVSPISIKLSNRVILDHYILDTQEILFEIYRNVSLGYKSYNFGTAIEGLHTINITIFCDVSSVNIAFIIIEKESIGDITEPLPPDPALSDTNITDQTQSGVRYYIPKEWTIGVIIFAGVGVGIPVILIVYRRKKNSMKL